MGVLQHGLANVLAILAERQKSAEDMKKAITCMRIAAEVYQQSGNSYWLPIANRKLAAMEAELLRLQQ